MHGFHIFFLHGPAEIFVERFSRRLELLKLHTDSALFAINTNRSKPTKFSPFYLMYGRHPRLPLEVQKYVEHVDNDPGGIKKLARELTSEDVLQEHVQKMTAPRDALFQ